MTDNTQQHGDEQSALSPRERILRGLQAMAAALNAADAWTDEARAGYRVASQTQYPQAVAPAGASTPKRCTECHHVFTAADLAAEDPQAWGHPCHGGGTRITNGVTPCESFREPIGEAGAGVPPDALRSVQPRYDPSIEREYLESQEYANLLRAEAAEQQRELLSGTVRQDAAVIADLIGQLEAAERTRDEARPAAVASTGTDRESWLEALDRAEAAEGTLATLRRLVDQFEADFANALDTVSDTVIFAQCTVPAFVKAVTAALTGDPAGPSQPAKRHYVGGSATRTACGRQRNKLPRGGSAYEWNYVTCPDCLATRPAPFTLDEQAGTVPPAPATEQPPRGVIEIAIEQARFSPCQSKRGAVVFSQAGPLVFAINGRGHNRKPDGFDCDGSDACKETCRAEAVHAEQKALLRAGPAAEGADLLHVKVVNGALVESGEPSCIQCSKLALSAGIAGVWLYRANGWRRYEAVEFHRLSLARGAVHEARPPQEEGFTESLDKSTTHGALRVTLAAAVRQLRTVDRLAVKLAEARPPQVDMDARVIGINKPADLRHLLAGVMCELQRSVVPDSLPMMVAQVCRDRARLITENDSLRQQLRRAEARPPQEIEKEIAALDAAGKARIAQIIDGIIPDVDSREREELASAIAVYISDLAEENKALRDNNRAVKAMSDERARAAAQAPQAPDDALDIYVPGRLRCPRCAFELTRAVLHAATGEIGMGRREVYMESEPCPNDGTPMARVTWQQEADSNQRYAMQLIADVLAATGADSLPAAFAKIKEEAASAPAPPGPKS